MLFRSRLFTRPDPGADGDLYADLNPNSETVLQECLVEPALTEQPVGETVQFERLGYFCPDPDSTLGRLVFNRTLGLRDTWAKLQAQAARHNDLQRRRGSSGPGGSGETSVTIPERAAGRGFVPGAKDSGSSPS